MGAQRQSRREDIAAAARRQERLQSVIEMFLKGKTPQEIGVKLGLTRAQVWHDFTTARRIWRKRNDVAIEKLVDFELAKLNQIEREAWEGWERSCQVSVEKTVEKTVEKGADGKKRYSKKRRYQSGDPRFLEIIARCSDRRCKLLKIGEYAENDAGVMVGSLVEVVVENIDQINKIMDFGDYEKLTDQSKVIDGEVVSREDSTDPDQ